MLRIQGLSVRFDGVTAVDDVSLDLPTGEVLAVLGPSGCGKSTLLRAVAGLEPLHRGTVTYDGEDLAGVPTHRRGFALMFQDGQLFPQQTVAGNVGYPLRLRRRGTDHVARRVGELLDLVGLQGYERRRPAELSGGERQRVALARALAADPRLLLLDEPLSALDRDLRERLALEVREILVAAGTTALLVTHDHDEVFTVADRVAVMRAGRLLQAGTVEEVWRAPVSGEAALLLGYPTVLRGEAARLLGRAGGRGSDGAAIALRRSALRADPAGRLAGRVLAATSTPELVRLRVLVDGLGEMHAVAPHASEVRIDHDIRLSVDMARTAVLPEPASTPGFSDSPVR